jgi:membrane-bound lytic murein transglycosylase D
LKSSKPHVPLLLITLLSVAGCATRAPETTPPPTVAELAGAETAPAPGAAVELPAAVEVTVLVEEDTLPPAAEAPPPPTDLLTRLTASLSLPLIDRSEVDRQLSWFVRHPDYMNRVFERSRRYLWYIMSELERRDMPADLALLPIVESAYDPFAYSHGRAAGLWQIIPGTGLRFGARQNWWYDGRRDIVDSTRAALDYLEFLHEEFDGDWLLAVAAYNSGEGNVLRAQKRNRAAGKPTDFWHLKLPRETSAYVPKLLALTRIMSDPAAHDLKLPDLPDAPYFEIVPLDGQVDLALLADLSGVDMDEIYALNPGYNRWATDPEGPHRALVPVAHAETLAAGLADTPTEARVRWVRYRIQQGDSLIAIASRHDTTPDVVRKVNGLDGNVIRAGEHLMIPTASRDLDLYTQSADLRLARTQARPRGASKVTYKVRPGDSLWEIAQDFGVSTRSLAKWNGMAPGDTLSVGKRLVVWTGKETPAQRPQDARVRKVNYTVRKGDSLARIAQKFRVTIGQLTDWNRLDARKYLQPGQRLVMYVDVTRQSGG